MFRPSLPNLVFGHDTPLHRRRVHGPARGLPGALRSQRAHGMVGWARPPRLHAVSNSNGAVRRGPCLAETQVGDDELFTFSSVPDSSKTLRSHLSPSWCTFMHHRHTHLIWSWRVRSENRANSSLALTTPLLNMQFFSKRTFSGTGSVFETSARARFTTLS